MPDQAEIRAHDSYNDPSRAVFPAKCGSWNLNCKLGQGLHEVECCRRPTNGNFGFAGCVAANY